MHVGKSARSVFVISMALSLGACFGGNDEGVALDGGMPAADGGSEIDRGGGGTGTLEDASTQSGIGDDAGGDAATELSSSAAHHVVYWGTCKTSMLTAMVLDSSSGKTIELELPMLQEIEHAVISHSGKYVLFAQRGFGDGTMPNPAKLYVFELETGTSTLLAEGDDEASSFNSISISLDDKWVAYGIQTQAGAIPYVVDIDGVGAAVPLMSATPYVYPLRWSTGGRLAVGYEDGSNYVFGIFKKNGGTWSGSQLPALSDLSHLGAWDQDENFYFVSPDESFVKHLAFVAAAENLDTVYEISSAAPTLAAATNVSDMRLSDDGKVLVFAADAELIDHEDAYAVTLVDGMIEQLTHFATSSPVGDLDDIMLSPDSRTMSISVRWDVTQGVAAVSGSELVVGIDGRQIARLDAPKTTFQVESHDEAFSPDGTMLYFRADARTEDTDELYGIDVRNAPAQAWKTPLLACDGDGEVEGLLVGK